MTASGDGVGRAAPGGRRWSEATIAELGPALARGEIGAADLAAECLAAIAANDRSGLGLGAIRALAPQALARARALDEVRPRSGALAPLHGIPIVLKDNIDLLGLPTTSGCLALARAMPKRDAAVVARLNAAGAVILAKTNLSEFSFEIRSRSSIGGDVLNPFNPAVTAGGSSGGAAAAVAAGFAAAAIGTDTGGSIRTPAAYNGLVGLRPTLGLIDRSGVAPLAPSTDTVGILTRCVADAGRLLDLLAASGRASGPAPPTDTRPLSTARIGVLRQAFGEDAEIARAMEAALAAMAGAGAVVIDPVALPSGVVPRGGDHVVDWEFGPAFDAYLRDNFQAGAPASIGAIIESGDYLHEFAQSLTARAAVVSLDADAYRAILSAHRRLRDALADLFDRHRLTALVYPTSAVVPTSLDNPRGGWAPELAACSGWPALSLPAGQAANGVPIGLELLGRAFEESALLGLAAHLERLLPPPPRSRRLR